MSAGESVVLRLHETTPDGVDESVVKTVSGSVKTKLLSAKTTARERRVSNQPGFVLHSWPYKETSVIVDVLTRDYGRIALIAKGAKRPHSQLRSVLQTFQPLQFAWTGKSEMRILTSAEWVGGMLPLEKSALLCGFYLNELLVKFLVRDEAHPILFDQYVSTLNQLAHDEPAQADARYVVDPETGVRLSTASDTAPVVIGKTLLDMVSGDYQDLQTQFQSKMLMRSLLAHHLHGAFLNTRQILIDLQNL